MASTDDNVLGAFVNDVADQPSVFFMADETVATRCREVIKHTFDASKRDELKKGLGPLPELYVDGFDSDQIWAELALQHAPLMKFVDRAVGKFLKRPHKVVLPVPESDDDSGSDSGAEYTGEQPASGSDVEGRAGAGSDEDSASEGGAGGDSDGDGDSEGNNGDGAASDGGDDGAGGNEPAAAAPSEDRFFSLEDMEKFADEDAEVGLGDDEGIDVFAPGGGEMASDDDDPYRGYTYEDMFGSGPSPGRKGKPSRDDASDDGSYPSDLDEGFEEVGAGGGAGNGGASDSEGDHDETMDGSEAEEVDESKLTPYQKEQRRLQAQIQDLEAEALAPKPWELTGEVKSGQRPENSLLETVMEYDQAQPAAPEITPETTAALEEVIKQRIRDEIWDDVERKVSEDLLNKRREDLPEVSQEKSKLGLGEIYEKEYLRQTNQSSEPDAKQVLRDEIGGLFKELCGRLDALSNFSFTPKPVVEDMAVKANAPAITMEEVIPTAVSDAKLQAPEEVYRKKRGREGIVVGDDELSREEKKRRRRARKAAKSKRHRQNEATRRLVERINPGLGNKYAKQDMMKELGRAKNVTKTVAAGADSTGSSAFKSAKFFAKLQDQVASEVAGFRGKKEEKKSATGSAAAFKL